MIGRDGGAFDPPRPWIPPGVASAGRTGWEQLICGDAGGRIDPDAVSDATGRRCESEQEMAIANV